MENHSTCNEISHRRSLIVNLWQIINVQNQNVFMSRQNETFQLSFIVKELLPLCFYSHLYLVSLLEDPMADWYLVCWYSERQPRKL
jgi:hypothetical protein